MDIVDIQNGKNGEKTNRINNNNKSEEIRVQKDHFRNWVQCTKQFNAGKCPKSNAYTSRHEHSKTSNRL